MSGMLELVNSKESKREYFATKDVDKCVAGAIERAENYYAEMNRTGRVNLYRNAYFKNFQGFVLKGVLFHSGQEGELTNTYINHYRNLNIHATNMVCQQKLSYEPQTTTDDSDAQEAARLARGVLYQYANRSDFDLDGKLRKATEMCQVFMESWVSVMWDKNTGRTIATDMDESQNPVEIKEGDNQVEVWTPFDVITDVTLSSYEQNNWIILRKWINKYDLAAMYPEWVDEITALSYGSGMRDTLLTYSINWDTDNLPVYHFFHKKGAVLPKGRTTIFLNDHIILADGDLDYREIPLYRMNEADLWGSPFGYCRSADTLPLQEMVDRLSSSILSNQITFATQNVLIPKGASISWDSLYGGLNVIEFDATLGEYGVPKALQLTSSPPETFKFLDWTITNMGTLRGINDAMKGNADLVLKGQASGAALALMSSNSIQFNSDLQKAYVRLAEQVGSALIHNLQDFAFPVDNMSREGMSMNGPSKYVKASFGKSQISKIEKIIVRYGNPLAQTTSGRMQIAESLLQNGLIKTPQEYLEVMETGNLDPVLKAQEAELNRLRENNEDLLKGVCPPVGPYDNFPLFIKEARAVLYNREARTRVKTVEAVKAYIQLCIAKWKQLSVMEPEVAALLDIPVLGAPTPQPPQTAPNPGGAPVASPKPSGPGMPAQNGAGLPQKVPVPTGV